jgi:hypothetical protein
MYFPSFYGGEMYLFDIDVNPAGVGEVYPLVKVIVSVLFLNPAQLVLLPQRDVYPLPQRRLFIAWKAILLHLCAHSSKLNRNNSIEESKVSACIQFLFLSHTAHSTSIITLERNQVFRQDFIISFLFIFLQDGTIVPQKI